MMQDNLDFSVKINGNFLKINMSGKLSGDHELMRKAVELQSLFKKKAKEE